jgi:hypothetical protein
MLEYSLGHMTDNTATFFIIAVYYKMITWTVKKNTGKVMPGAWTFILIFISTYFVLFHFFNFDLFVFTYVATSIIIIAFDSSVKDIDRVVELVFYIPLWIFLVVYIPNWIFHEIIRLKRFVSKRSQQDTDIADVHNKEQLSSKSDMPMRLLIVVAIMFIFSYLFSLL